MLPQRLFDGEQRSMYYMKHGKPRRSAEKLFPRALTTCNVASSRSTPACAMYKKNFTRFENLLACWNMPRQSLNVSSTMHTTNTCALHASKLCHHLRSLRLMHISPSCASVAVHTPRSLRISRRGSRWKPSCIWPRRHISSALSISNPMPPCLRACKTPSNAQKARLLELVEHHKVVLTNMPLMPVS